MFERIAEYELVWSDEFEYEGAPDPEKWGFETGNHQWANCELQAYTDRPGNVFVKDGKLTIRALKEQDGERAYTSARMTTYGKQSWQYGYFEIRARLPEGRGSWPAFWFLADSIKEGMPWPRCGEIDMMEHTAVHKNTLVYSLHSLKHNHTRQDTVQYSTSVFCPGVCDEYHVYGMEWTADYVEYFFDGMSVCKYCRTDDSEDQTEAAWPYDQPFFMILNIAVGGFMGGDVAEEDLPYTMELDYVRVYRKRALQDTGMEALITECGRKEKRERPLSIQDGKIVNYKGEEVILRGVNLGGWLLQESWMCPVNGEDRKWANLDTLKVLESRFSEKEVQTLFDTYQDNWITWEDIREIASLGCNALRVPFWYRNFMKDEQGTWIAEDPNENPGFKRLDWVIAQAAKYGMYVILDMHGCPGGQSMDHCCGTLCENRLYTEEQCQETMEELWTAIAERYKDNITVAAYDIMNEPQNNIGYEGENSYDPWESRSWEMSNRIYDRMIQAIRRVDQDHIITLEGIWSITNLPEPADMGWTNMMYQLHLYDEDDTFRNLTADLAERSKRYNVAAYIGEFQNLNGLGICNEYKASWTTWTFKGTNEDVLDFFWYFGTPERADCEKDSYEEILRKWGDPIRTEHFAGKLKVQRMIEKYAGQ